MKAPCALLNFKAASAPFHSITALLWSKGASLVWLSRELPDDPHLSTKEGPAAAAAFWEEGHLGDC